MYYFFIEDNKINGSGELPIDTEGFTNIEVSDEVYNAFMQDNDRFIYQNGEIIENLDYEETKRQKEQEHINNLTMTAQDLLDFIANNGASWEEIDNFLNANKEFKLRLTTCQNVFCGVLRQFLPLSIGNVTLTDEMVINAFKVKNGENPDV